MPVKQSFTDIDEHAAQMSGFDQQYVQLSPGPFHGVFSSCALPYGIGFDVEWVAQSMHQHACVPQHTVSLVTFVDLRGRAIFNGHGVNAHDTFLLAPGTELDVRTPPGVTIAVVTIPQQLLNSELPAAGESNRHRGRANATRLLNASACARALRPMLLSLLHALDTGPELLADVTFSQSMANGLLDSALRLTCSSAGHRDVAALSSANRRREVFLSALDAIDRVDSVDLAVWELCRIAGVSRRTLEYCFEESVAMSPSQYMKIKRLNAVRRELVGAAGAEVTIGDVAARQGIWHLSRLSKEYAQLFGELPSATLRRSRALSGGVSKRNVPNPGV